MTFDELIKKAKEQFKPRKDFVILKEPVPGYQEGDQDFVQDNFEICVMFLEALEANKGK